MCIDPPLHVTRHGQKQTVLTGYSAGILDNSKHTLTVTKITGHFMHSILVGSNESFKKSSISPNGDEKYRGNRGNIAWKRKVTV